MTCVPVTWREDDDVDVWPGPLLPVPTRSTLPARRPDPSPVRHTRPAATPARQTFAPAGTWTHLTDTPRDVQAWLDRHRVPTSPAGTVMLFKGVGPDYRSANGTLYPPGALVTDPGWGRRTGAGLYLCATVRAVRAFVENRHPDGWVLLLVETAACQIVVARDRRKVMTPRLYVHRRIDP